MPTYDDSTQPTQPDPISALAPMVFGLFAICGRMKRYRRSLHPYRPDLLGLSLQIIDRLDDAAIKMVGFLHDARISREQAEDTTADPIGVPPPKYGNGPLGVVVSELLALDRRLAVWIGSVEIAPDSDPLYNERRARLLETVATVRVDVLTPALADLNRLRRLQKSHALDELMRDLHRLDAEQAAEILDRGVGDES